MLVAAIDVGSPAKIGWATNDGRSGCGELDSLVEALADCLNSGGRVALGFEAPLWVPAGREYARMTANRGGVEAQLSRPWSAGAGCGALAAGVANMSWLFRALQERCGAIQATFDQHAFSSGSAQLLVWEAFVSGHLKGGSHIGDAELAVAAFCANWPNLVSAVDHTEAVNLAAAALAAAGHEIRFSELGLPAVVVSAGQIKRN